jgi:hypothetical protein
LLPVEEIGSGRSRRTLENAKQPLAMRMRYLWLNGPYAAITVIGDALNSVDYLCSGTLLKRTKICCKASCRCAQDANARHDPYYEWGHMKGGKLVRSSRRLSPIG